MRHRSQPSKPPQVGRALFVALALLVPLATACGDETPPEKPGSSETQADASVSERVGPGTRLDATRVATAVGRSTSRPLRLRVSGPSFSLDPTFPVAPLGWTDTSRSFAVQPDGKLLTAYAISKDSWPGGAKGFVLERHQAEGVPDLAFGMLGTVTHQRPAVLRLLALKPLPTGGARSELRGRGRRFGPVHRQSPRPP